MVQSRRLWQTIWVDAETTSTQKDRKVEHEQVWISQPAFWDTPNIRQLSAVSGEDPHFLRILNG